jgi:cation diffusion facilitator family transporter
VVLVTVVAVKELLFRFAFRIGRATGSTAVVADAWHHRSDAITSAAAFAGISLALFLGKGYEACDDWAALLACGVIAWNGARLFRPALAEVMDAVPPGLVEDDVRRVAGAVDGVRGLEKCRIRKYGTSLHVDLHVLVDGEATVRRGHHISHAVKNALRSANPRIADVLVHIEPFG